MMATYSQGKKTKSTTRKPRASARQIKFKIVNSALQRIQLQEIAKENGLNTEEEALSLLISEYRLKYQ